MGCSVRLSLLSSISLLVFFSALFLFSFLSLWLYLLFFFSTVCICCCFLAFNLLRHKQRSPTTLHTTSVTTKADVPSSSSSSPPSGKLTYDVFLSFRGKDTRRNFTDHLYTALKQKGIFTFRDDEELERGESIAPNLLKAIEESRYVIAVFSRNYADSAWCLDEIAKIAECMKDMGQKVLPVFYHVDPFEVRRQTGEFGKPFAKHQKRFKDDPDKLQRWKKALFQVGNLSGWHLQDGYESIVIQEIVDKIFTELNQIISISEGLVGMDSRLNEMLSYIDIGCPDVRIIGICGMGGIGKTTIAQVVFERLQTQFEGYSFLENVKEVFEKQGAVHLQEQLLLNLLKCNVNVQNTKMGKNIMRQRLRTKMVLIILDDVDQEEQLEALCDRESFGPGSRIIITSRDEHLLSAVEGDKVYKVNPLTDVEALQLFSMKAFKKDQLVGEEVLKLAKEFLKYANGLPLAIKVLGSSVKGRSVELWSSALDRLKEDPEKKIINVLKVSFDGLEPREQKIFLDIACFFKGENIDHVRRILQGSDAHCPDFDLQVLLDRSMVTLFGKKLWMHDMIQELGWEVVRQECCDEPGKRSRLWLPNEIIDVLDQSKATSAVQSILLQGPTKDDVVHSVNDSFSNMDRLRLLKIWNVKFSGNIKYLSKKLQFMEWHECPLDSFPSDFQPDNLVKLYMHSSRIEQLWRGLNVLLGEEIDHVRLITLNRPRQLNVITSNMVSLLAENLEKWEKDDKAELVIIKGSGRAFSAGGDLKMFYDGRKSKDSCLEIVYRMYWLCYHIHTYKKTQVALVHGISMGGGASLMVPMKFSVVTEKTVFSTPEASIGFHTDCGFSYTLSHLPGHLGEFLALTGARLNGKELVAAGLATHFVPLERLSDVEKRLISLNSGDANAVKAAIEEFSVKVQLDEESVLNKQSIIDECFSKDTVAEIINSFEAEAKKEGNGWIGPVLNGLKRSSPTGLRITLGSIRKGRKQTLAESLKKEFRLTINILRSTISEDVYEGIRALTIDKDNAPKWNPPTLDKVDDEKIDLVFEPFIEDLELKIEEKEELRWDGKYENSDYASLN